MYAWIWRHLPGNLPVRALLAVLLLGGAVLLLLFVVFPIIDPHLPWNDVNVAPPSGATGSAG